MYVEPERRDLSSIPPQATRWPECQVFRGSELQLRHKAQAFNRASAPEEQILAFLRST